MTEWKPEERMNMFKEMTLVITDIPDHPSLTNVANRMLYAKLVTGKKNVKILGNLCRATACKFHG